MNKYMFRVLWLLLVPLMAACVSETDFLPTEEGGRLCLSFDNIVTAVTRTTPEDLSKPAFNEFNIRIERLGGHTVYNGPFKGENETMELTVPVGDYTITAEYGSNPLMGRDTPYYIGSSSATVVKDQQTSVPISCKVGNALISAQFGENEKETERFSRYFSDYGLYVSIDNYSMGITGDAPWLSIYVRAGSHVELSFRGELTDGTPFSQPLTNETINGENIFPDVLNAGDHAIVTLTMPDPENDLTVNISKVEMDTVTFDETIPLSWLPKPRVGAEHKYDEKGELVGTDLNFNNAYPGLTWRAVITNAEGETVRDLTDAGALTSAYISSAEWPYLPQGEYKAVYYIVSGDGQGGTKETKINEGTITVPDPDLHVTLGGYTAHTKWEEGDVDAANACERLTVYEPSVYVNISEALLKNANYTYTFTYTYDNNTQNAPIGSNIYRGENMTNQAVQGDPHILKGNVTFAGTTVQEAQRELRITGLPVNFNPPKEGEGDLGWKRGSGTYSFTDSYAKLGNRGGILTEYNENILNSSSVYIPIGTVITLDFNLMIHPATVGTTFTVTDNANLTFCSERESGGAANSRDYDHIGTSGPITVSTPVTQLKCNNSYGGGATCTYIYSLYFKYAK